MDTDALKIYIFVFIICIIIKRIKKITITGIEITKNLLFSKILNQNFTHVLLVVKG